MFSLTTTQHLSESPTENQINQLSMSSTVLYFHNILGREEAEEKLVADGISNTFLARRSPLNEDYYILSYLVNGKFKHDIIVNCKPASGDSVKLENVFALLKEMVKTNSDCENAVFALSTDGQEEAHSEHEVGEFSFINCEAKHLRPQCYVCHLSFYNKRQRNDHLNDHKVKKCSICGLFIPSRNHPRHFKLCSGTPAPMCTQCDYTTHYNMKKHVQAVHGKEFSCSDCGKTFSCKEKLEVHIVLHQGQRKSQDAVANCLCCPCWNCDYTLRTTHSRENSLHKLRIDNELKLRQFSIKIVIKFIKSCKLVERLGLKSISNMLMCSVYL